MSKMVEIPEAGSIAATIALGSTLGSSLDTFIGSLRYPKDKIVDLTAKINATTNVLRHLEEFTRTHEAESLLPNQTEPVLRQAGYQEILLRVRQCEILYRTVIAIITKAGMASSKVKPKTDAIDTSYLKHSLIARDTRWHWLRPRVKKILEQIEIVRSNLLLILRVAILAKHQLSITQRYPGMFEEELALRYLVEGLKRERYRQVTALAKKYKKPVSPPLSTKSSLSRIEIIEEIPIIQAPPPPIVPTINPEPEIEIIEVQKESDSTPPPYSGPSSKGMEPILGQKRWESNVPAPLPPPPPPPAVNKTAEMTEKPEKVKPIEEKEIIKSVIEQKNKGVEFITINSFKQRFGKVDSWFKELFGPSSLFFDDKESQEIEAFMILGDKKRLKVPFGHRRLKFGMKKLMKKKKSNTLDDYYSLPKHLHGAISQVLQCAKVVDSRERVVICFDALELGDKPEDQHLLVFFAINGPPLDPIRFKDAVGRKFDVPYHLVLTWEEMRAMVNQAFLHVDVIGPHVQEGHFDLIGPSGTIILPTCWEGTVKPGMRISMHMWPMNSPRPPQQHLWPGPPRPPGFPKSLPWPGPAPSFPPGPGAGPGRFPPRPGAPSFPRPPMPVGGKPIVLGGVPAPPPPAAPSFIPLIPASKKKIRRRRSFSTISSYTSTDSSDLDSDSDIEGEETDLGIKFDYEKEKEEAKTNVKALLIKWTNAVDVEGQSMSPSSYTSSSGSDSSDY